VRRSSSSRGRRTRGWRTGTTDRRTSHSSWLDTHLHGGSTLLSTPLGWGSSRRRGPGCVRYRPASVPPRGRGSASPSTVRVGSRRIRYPRGCVCRRGPPESGSASARGSWPADSMAITG
jgi:hypothetical protein